MKTLHITEFNAVHHLVPALHVPPLVEQDVVIDGESHTSEPFHRATRFVRLLAHGDCAITWGTDPEANPDSMPLLAGRSEVFAVPDNDATFRLAVISSVRS